MFLKHLYARNFRNFDQISVDFEDGINEVVGDNAQGKTSLLEALFLCMTASSFRSQHLKELIRLSEKGFFVEASFEKAGVDTQVGISYDGVKRRVFLNGSPCETPTVLLGLMPGVASTPDDIAVVKGEPRLRRRYLDLMLAQVDPVFVHHLTRFLRALQQRTGLLKQKQIGTIACWEEELARSSAYISLQRKRAVDFVSQKAGEYFYAFSQEKLPLTITYASNLRLVADVEEQRKLVLAEFEKRRAQEVHLGATLVGPHRDDLQMVIGDKPAREFASVGQSALVACALRLAEWHFLERETFNRPLMIVDDIGYALDSTRKRLLFTELGKLGQLFLSSHSSIQAGRTIHIHEGKLR